MTEAARSRRSSLWAQIAGTTGAKLYSMLLSVGSLALTARLLGPEGRGQVAGVLGWVALFSTFGHLSLGQVMIHRATTRKSAEWFSQVLGSGAALAAALALTGWVVAAAMSALPRGSPFGALPVGLLALGFLMLPFLIWEQYGSALLIATQRIGVYNRALVVGRTLALLSLVVLVGAFSAGVQGALAAAVLGQVVIAGWGFRLLLRHAGGTAKPTMAESRELLLGGLKLHLNAVGAFMLTSSGVLFVNYHRGAQETAFFQLANQLVSVIMLVPQASSMVLYGEISAKGPNGAWASTKSVLRASIGMTLAVGAAGWIFAPWVIALVAGPKFAPAVEVFRWSLPMLVGGALSSVMAAQWIGRGLFLQASSITLAIGLLSVGLNVLLVPRFGMLGAVYASLACFAVSSLINLGMYAYCAKQAGTSGADRP